MAHETSVKVRFYELDPYNHVNHSPYVQYFEVGRIELLESTGFDLARLDEIGLHIVVTGITTRFLRSAGPGDMLVVRTVVREMRRATMVFDQEILRNGEVVATQVVDAVMTDRTGKPSRIESGLADALERHIPR